MDFLRTGFWGLSRLSGGCTIAALLAFVLTACTPRVFPPGPPVVAPRLHSQHFVASDGVVLPLRRWLPVGVPRAVVVAVHGFNDYSRFFERPAAFLARRGVASYAYDQRGFGGAPRRGLWAGLDAYRRDLVEFTTVVRAAHPGIPVFLLGESMGAAVVITALSAAPAPAVHGAILVAPAIWARHTMPWYQRAALWLSAHTLPELTVTGRSLKRIPTDNIEVLRELARDPRVIKETRIDAVYGLANLMDAALAEAPSLQVPVLVLYGKRDQIIPKKPILRLLHKLAGRNGVRIAIYPRGYHLLLRDRSAGEPLRDIAAWLAAPARASLPASRELPQAGAAAAGADGG